MGKYTLDILNKISVLIDKKPIAVCYIATLIAITAWISIIYTN